MNWTYNVVFVSNVWGENYTNVTLFHKGVQVGKWTYYNNPFWLKRRIKKLRKKYGAMYE